MTRTIALINPPLVTHAKDPLGSGIPYLPVTLSYLAAVLAREYSLKVVDVFGRAPLTVKAEAGFWLQGEASVQWALELSGDTLAAVVYVSSVMAFLAVKKIISEFKTVFPGIPLIAIENSQAVIGCPLEYLAGDLIRAGADFIVLGECEDRVPRLCRALGLKDLTGLTGIDGLVYPDPDGSLIRQPVSGRVQELNRLPFPAWEFFPLENYWKLGYAHGPMEGRYLALQTSRGCPLDCNFCVVPATNAGKWRARSPENVIAEIESLTRRFGVREFHLEDLNPTAGEKRILELCALLTQKKLGIVWKLASGAKIESFSPETLARMREAGCRYVSFSPESGSPAVLERMNKKFDHARALTLAARMHELGVATQACFVIGYPEETPADLRQTSDYVRHLARAGVDEIAVFMLTPIPGTRTFGQIRGYGSYAEMTFAPVWRSDYPALKRYRTRLYLSFFIWKLCSHPGKLVRQLLNLLRGKFTTKAEMNVYRLFSLKFRTLPAKDAHEK